MAVETMWRDNLGSTAEQRVQWATDDQRSSEAKQQNLRWAAGMARAAEGCNATLDAEYWWGVHRNLEGK